MKKTILIFTSFCFSFFAFAQTNNFSCASDDMSQKLLEEHPWLASARAQIDSFTAQYIRSQSGHQSRSGQIYTIPIVFHILHNYGPENISDDQIYDAVRILNEDFRLRNSDTSQIVNAFKAVAADCEIEFRLATQDPNRNCTNGINRYRSMLTYLGSDDAKFVIWPRELYLNIWVVNSISRPGVAGYAYLPPGMDGLLGLVDGIIILHNYVGSIGTGNYTRARALTHEMGHSLNLLHTWGQGEPGQTCGDDGIPDIPVTRGWQTCNLNGSICVPGVIENVQNHMEYSFCSRMFTHGQKLRMHATLNSDAAKRINLWQPSTLQFTGADVSQNINICPPIADFNINNKAVCIGNSVNFRDHSWRGPITEWNWEFENATPAQSTDRNPTVIFNQSGWQRVSLTVKSANGQDTKADDRYVYVNDGFARPFFEDFESGESFEQDGYIIENFEGNETEWRLTNKTSFSGGQCLMLNNHAINRYDVDAFITPEYDYAGFVNPSLRFKYSLATRTNISSNIEDRFRIYYSINCGNTWVSMYNTAGVDLINAGAFEHFFIPSSEADWSEIDIPLPPAAFNNGKAMFKFEFTRNKYANNLFIDDINVDRLYSSAAITDHIDLDWNVYPNPTQQNFFIRINSPQSQTGIIQVFDMKGQLVYKEKRFITQGENKMLISNKFASGLYHLNLLLNEQNYQKKLVIMGN